MIQKILFICTGNTCRSLMAEHLFKKMVKESGIRVEVRSAGIAAGINSQIPALTLRVLENEGVCPDGHIVTQLTAALVKWADLILAMEVPHANIAIELCPEARGKVFLLTEYTSRPLAERCNQPISQPPLDTTTFRDKGNIPDPFGGSREAYETCLSQIKECLGRLIEALRGERE